jgi:drug/metabolite transporter (DMT)-like permease
MNVKKSYVSYLASLFMFGMNGIVASFIKLSSYEIVFTRTLIGSLFLIIIFAITKHKINLFKHKKHGFYLIMSSIAMGASWLFLYEAYNRIGVGIASLLYYCGPVFVMILAPLIFREKLTITKILGFLSVLLGMLFVNVQAFQDGKSLTGILYGIMSALLFAIMIILNKKARSITGLENSMWQVLTSFLTVAVFVGMKQGFIIHINSASIVPILILGIFNTGLGCYFYFSSIGNLPVQTVAICGYLEPLSAVIFSVLFLQECMSKIQIIGAVFIIGGAAFGELYQLYSEKLNMSLMKSSKIADKVQESN